MIKRTKLSNRQLPIYTKGEETMNMVTHIVGGGVGVIALVICILKSVLNNNGSEIIGSVIYGTTMTTMYTVSSVYHGLNKPTSKKVMQIIDHCVIYFLIAGTYTPILLAKFIPAYPIIGISLLIAQWLLCFFATTLTAIDLHEYRVLSMICYIAMGWSIILFIPQTIFLLGAQGFLWLLAGGITYTIGAILYGLGVKIRWMHSVFHIFVVLGSIFHLIAIFFYTL